MLNSTPKTSKLEFKRKMEQLEEDLKDLEKENDELEEENKNLTNQIDQLKRSYNIDQLSISNDRKPLIAHVDQQSSCVLFGQTCW